MAVPTLSSASLNAAGSQLSTTWSVAVQLINGSVPSLRVPARGVSVVSTYASGDGTVTMKWTMSKVGLIYMGDIVVLDMADSAIAAVVGGEGNLIITGADVTNAVNVGRIFASFYDQSAEFTYAREALRRRRARREAAV